MCLPTRTDPASPGADLCCTGVRLDPFARPGNVATVTRASQEAWIAATRDPAEGGIFFL
jgi:hypothetical protein